MSDASLAAMSALVVVALVCLFGILIAALLGAGLFLVMRRSARVFTHANQALRANTADYFADAASGLLTWESHALADLASHLEMNGIAGVGLHYRGAIKSLSQPHADWLAFDLRLNWRVQGALVLRAANRAVQLELVNNSADNARVRVDRIEFGSLRERSDAIEFSDVTQQRVGQYRRHRREPQLGRSGVEDVTPRYGAVEIGDRRIAELNYNLIPNQYVAQLAQPIPALLRDLAPELTSQEEDWLLALIALEVYYRIARKVSDARRRHRSWSMR